MAEPQSGATYADAIIGALRFAQENPVTFLATVLPTLTLVIIILLLWFRFIVARPLGRQWEAYRARRNDRRKPPSGSDQ